MTELEWRALLGDRQAQEECTRRGILLPCWKCGGEAEVNELHTGGKPIYAAACKKHHCGAYGAGSASVPKAIEFWNTRTAPPVGSCGECEKSPDIGTKTKGMRWCRRFRTEVKLDGYCDGFKPKEGEENAAD